MNSQSHENNINIETLKSIINIKCRQFCNLTYVTNENATLSFTNAFYIYLESALVKYKV
jgi:hypothetical protein